MSQIPEKYIELVRGNEPIYYAGLEFQPLTMRHYETLSACRAAWELMQASLPAKFARYSWLEALWHLDLYNLQTVGKKAGFMDRIAEILRLSLRLGENASAIKYKANTQTGNLIELLIQQGEMLSHITPQQFNEIRTIIAAQNGLDIPDESWNPEIIQAGKDVAALSHVNLKFSLDDLVVSVAHLSAAEEEEIWDWPIRKFTARKDAIERDRNNLIFSIAEHTGFVTFKKGNPYPSPFFDKENNTPAGLIDYNEFVKNNLAAATPANAMPGGMPG